MSHSERKIEIFRSESFSGDMDESRVTIQEVERAVGYLALWAIHNSRYCRVRLVLGHRSNCEISAEYYDKDDNLNYEIGAVLREDNTYGFHS